MDARHCETVTATTVNATATAASVVPPACGPMPMGRGMHKGSVHSAPYQYTTGMVRTPTKKGGPTA